MFQIAIINKLNFGLIDTMNQTVSLITLLWNWAFFNTFHEHMSFSNFCGDFQINWQNYNFFFMLRGTPTAKVSASSADSDSLEGEALELESTTRKGAAFEL